MPFWKSDKRRSTNGLQQDYDYEDGQSSQAHEHRSSTYLQAEEKKAPLSPQIQTHAPSSSFGGQAAQLTQASGSSRYAPPQSALFRTQLASISMHMWDRMRILDFPPAVIDLVREVIQHSWPKGIQAECVYGGAYEFKYRGNPWRGVYEDAIESRRVIRSLYAALFEQGWVLAFATDLSKKQRDSDTLIFRYQNVMPAPHEWICVAFSRKDRLRLLDAPPELCEAVQTELGPAVQSREQHYQAGVFELKLHGCPWFAYGEETMSTRRLILQLIGVLESHGFSVYSSVDQKTGSGGDYGGSETDTWHCCRRVGWRPGEPVFHA